ncbi:unnamed protein product, partial [Gongylonema pulchrum]|uniref:Homeobox domain-containing protein n=1 Tax=Gongylonema pulchrum TaxID=637853 RepID=A0A183D5S8_9BILA
TSYVATVSHSEDSVDCAELSKFYCLFGLVRNSILAKIFADYCEEDALGATHKSKRMRTSFKHHQLRTMKSYFNLNHNPDAKDLKQLAQRTGLTKRVLQVWFQNARAKFRRNSMRHREASSSSPHGPHLVSTRCDKPVNSVILESTFYKTAALGLGVTCNSVGGSVEDSIISVSPEEGSQREEQSCSPVEDDELNPGKIENESGHCNNSPVKSLADYFETDHTLL